MIRKSVLISVVALSIGFMEGALANKQAAYTVVEDGIPEPLVSGGGDPESGRKVLINRKQGNCLACHAITALSDQPFHGEVGPSLDGVADRWSEAQLRLLVVNSKAVFEDTIMPAFHRTDGFNRVAKNFKDKTLLSAQQVEDVVAYLLTLKE